MLKGPRNGTRGEVDEPKGLKIERRGREEVKGEGEGARIREEGCV